MALFSRIAWRLPPLITIVAIGQWVRLVQTRTQIVRRQDRYDLPVGSFGKKRGRPAHHVQSVIGMCLTSLETLPRTTVIRDGRQAASSIERA